MISESNRNAKERNNMTLRRTLSAALVVAALSASAAESTAMRLYCSPDRNLTWQTITTPIVSLRLNWPKGATGAELTIVNANGENVLSQAIAAGTPTYDWMVFTGDAPASDDCFEVTVVYSTGDTDTAVLALEKGTFAPIVAHVADSQKAFARTTGGRAVVYDTAWFGKGTESVTLSSVARSTGAETVQTVDDVRNGYFRWSPDGTIGWYDLTLSCGSQELSGCAYWGNPGLMLMFR